MAVRPYRPADRDACLRLFHGNVPRYFTPAEEAEYLAFLDALPGPYLVLERAGAVVGAGGHAYDGPATVALCWGMVAASLHGTGLGQVLLEARLVAVARDPAVRTVRIATSQHTEGFFARAGFLTVGVQPDGFGPGLHRHDMELAIAAGGAGLETGAAAGDAT
jgi:GNAT superfamily N-acetyltransferase